MRTVADIDSAAALLKVRRFKQLEKARDRDKASKPLKKRTTKVSGSTKRRSATKGKVPKK